MKEVITEFNKNDKKLQEELEILKIELLNEEFDDWD